MLRSGQARV